MQWRIEATITGIHERSDQLANRRRDGLLNGAEYMVLLFSGLFLRDAIDSFFLH